MKPSSCSRSQNNTSPPRSRNTRIPDVGEFHKDCCTIRFEVDEFDGAVAVLILVLLIPTFYEIEIFDSEPPGKWTPLHFP